MAIPIWDRMVSRWQEQRRRRSIRHHQIEWDADSVRVIACFKNGRSEVEWSKDWCEIRKAVAYKLDLVFYDCIRLGLEDGSGRWTGMDEEMPGWDEFMADLPDHLPGAKRWEDVFDQVARPPFRENATVLFERRRDRC